MPNYKNLNVEVFDEFLRSVMLTPDVKDPTNTPAFLSLSSAFARLEEWFNNFQGSELQPSGNQKPLTASSAETASARASAVYLASLIYWRFCTSRRTPTKVSRSILVTKAQLRSIPPVGGSFLYKHPAGRHCSSWTGLNVSKGDPGDMSFTDADERSDVPGAVGALWVTTKDIKSKVVFVNDDPTRDCVYSMRSYLQTMSQQSRKTHPALSRAFTTLVSDVSCVLDILMDASSEYEVILYHPNGIEVTRLT